MLKVSSIVNVYELDDKDVDWQKNSIIVKSHWNQDTFIVLVVGEHSYTVVASELKAAIQNATNSARF